MNPIGFMWYLLTIDETPYLHNAPHLHSTDVVSTLSVGDLFTCE